VTERIVLPPPYSLSYPAGTINSKHKKCFEGLRFFIQSQTLSRPNFLAIALKRQREKSLIIITSAPFKMVDFRKLRKVEI